MPEAPGIKAGGQGLGLEIEVLQVVEPPCPELVGAHALRRRDADRAGLRRFAEALEDKLRKKAMSPATLREAFQLISAADRVLSNVSSAGKKLMEELTPGAEEGGPVKDDPGPVEEPGTDQKPQSEAPPATD